MMKSFLSVHINLVTTTQFSRTRLGAGDKHGMTKVVTDGFVAVSKELYRPSCFIV